MPNMPQIVVEFSTTNNIHHTEDTINAHYHGYGYIDGAGQQENGEYCLIIYETSPDISEKLIANFLSDSRDAQQSAILCHTNKLKRLDDTLRIVYRQQLHPRSSKLPNWIKNWETRIIDKASRGNLVSTESINQAGVFNLQKVAPMITAKDIMVKNPNTVKPDYSVLDAYNLMHILDTGHLPVLDNRSSKLLGLVSDTVLLPYIPPEDIDYPRNLKAIKIEESRNKKVSDVWTPFDKLKYCYENESVATLVKKFFRQNRPPINLLLVLNNDKEKTLTGVISWVEVLKHWSTLIVEQPLIAGKYSQASDVAVPLENIPFLDETRGYKVGSALDLLWSNTTQRHLRIIDNNTLVKIFHAHELASYQTLGDNVELKIFFHNLDIKKIPPKHSIRDRTIPYNMPIWSDDDKNVIKKFLQHIVGKGKKWQDRMAGLLLAQPDGKLTHLLNPFDIIKKLL